MGLDSDAPLSPIMTCTTGEARWLQAPWPVPRPQDHFALVKGVLVSCLESLRACLHTLSPSVKDQLEFPRNAMEEPASIGKETRLMIEFLAVYLHSPDPKATLVESARLHSPLSVNLRDLRPSFQLPDDQETRIEEATSLCRVVSGAKPRRMLPTSSILLESRSSQGMTY